MTDFRSFVAEKELEWKSALNQQIALLEETLASRESELREERKMSAQLKEDFKYNIRLVKERDDELAGMERENILLKQQRLSLEDRLSAVSVRLDEVQQKLALESDDRAKLAERLKSDAESRDRELQLLQHERDLEASRMRDEQQGLRRQLEMEAARARKETEVQKRELTGAFDRRADELQAEYDRRVAQLEKELLDREVNCDLLDKECASLRQARLALLHRLETGEIETAALEKKLAESAARFQSDIAVLENEKERLNELLATLEVRHRHAAERLEQKLASAQAELSRRDELTAEAAAKHRDDRLSVRKQTADLLGKLHEAEASFQRKADEFQAQLRVKDDAVVKLNAEIDELKAQVHLSKSEVARLFVDRDAEIDRLKRQLESCREEISNRVADVDRYKRELEMAMGREREVEAIRHQLEIDYQRKMGELDTLQYEKSETYIERLTQARNEALLQVDELKTSLAQKQTFIQSLLKDRETALAAMKEHGISLDRRMESKAAERDLLAESEKQVRELSLQNDTLREIVKQMRQEMESLGGAMGSAAGGQQPKQQQSSPGNHPTAQPAISPALGDIRSIQELSNVLAKLRSEKTDLLAQCRKQQARIGHLESRIDECQSDKAAADTAVEQLKYQLSAQDRHHATEAAGSKRRLQELESQLDETQREADEYYKANIEQGKLCEQLQHQLLSVKAKLLAAAPKPGEVNFGAQELYIQQLQSEIEELRARMRARQLFEVDDEAATPAPGDGKAGAGYGRSSEEVTRLRAKLKMAANQIKKLAQENQALVDLSNRLRADLNRASGGGGFGIAGGAANRRQTQLQQHQHQGQAIELESHASRAVKDAVGGMTEKLKELERMQYYLTREELARQNAATRQHIQQASLGDSQPVKDPGSGAAAAAASATSGNYRRAAGLRIAAAAAGGGRAADSLNLSSVGGGGESLREVWQLLDSTEVPNQL